MQIEHLKKFPFHEGVVWSLIVFWASLTFSPALMSISFFTALICWVIWKIQTKDFTLRVEKCVWIPLAVFFVICAASFFWSDFPKQSWKGITKTAKQILIFLMTAEIFVSRKNMRKFEYGFLAVLSVVVLNGYFQYAFGFDFIRHIEAQDSSAGARISASFKTYGLLGCFLLSTLPYLTLLGLRFRNKDKKMLPWYIAFPVSFGGAFLLFLTRSRGAILAFALGLFGLMLYRKKWVPLLILLGIFAGAIYSLPPSMIIHLNAERKEQSVVERVYLWDRAIQVIQAKPILGTGINTYTSAHALYDKRKNWRVKNYYAHNGYLQMTAEIGLPGLTAFLIFLFMIFKSGRRCEKIVPDNHDRAVLMGCMAGIFNFLLFAMVDTVMHNPQSILMLWFLLGIYLAYQRQLTESSPLDPKA